MADLSFGLLPVLVIANALHATLRFEKILIEINEREFGHMERIEFVLFGLMVLGLVLNMYSDIILLGFMINEKFNKGCDHFFIGFVAIGFFHLVFLSGLAFCHTILICRVGQVKDRFVVLMEGIGVQYTYIFFTFVVILIGIFFNFSLFIGLSECDSDQEVRRYGKLALVSLLIGQYFFSNRYISPYVPEAIQYSNWVLDWFLMFVVCLVSTLIAHFEEDDNKEMFRFIRFSTLSFVSSTIKINALSVLSYTELIQGRYYLSPQGTRTGHLQSRGIRI